MELPNPKSFRCSGNLFAGGVMKGATHRAQRKGPHWGMGGVSTVGLFNATGPAT